MNWTSRSNTLKLELRQDMDAAGRKKLLRLLDAQNALLTESTLMKLHGGLQTGVGHGKKNWRQMGSAPSRKERRTHLPSGGNRED